jgi:hypothetical protein
MDWSTMMYWQFTPYVIPVILSVAISATLAIFALRRRPTPGATSFSLLMFAVAEWALGYALELVSPGLPAKLFWDNVSWLGAVVTPAAWFAFTLEYTGRGRWLTRRNVAFLTIEPFIILLLVWSNPLHGLVNSHVTLNNKGPFSALFFTYGAAFWVDIVYSYLLLLSGAFFIVSLIHSFSVPLSRTSRRVTGCDGCTMDRERVNDLWLESIPEPGSDPFCVYDHGHSHGLESLPFSTVGYPANSA